MISSGNFGSILRSLPLSPKQTVASAIAICCGFTALGAFCGYKAYRIDRFLASTVPPGIDISNKKMERALYIAGVIGNCIASLFALKLGVLIINAKLGPNYLQKKLMVMLTPPSSSWIVPENANLLAEVGLNLTYQVWGAIATIALAGLALFLGGEVGKRTQALLQMGPGGAAAARVRTERKVLIVLTSLGIGMASLAGFWTAYNGCYAFGQALILPTYLGAKDKAQQEGARLLMALCGNVTRYWSMMAIAAGALGSVAVFYADVRRA